MITSIEETRNAIEVMEAYVNGKTIQLRKKRRIDEWCETDMPTWDFYAYEYRIKPDSKEYPFTMNYFLKTLCIYLKFPDIPTIYLIQEICSNGLGTKGQIWRWEYLMQYKATISKDGLNWRNAWESN